MAGEPLPGLTAVLAAQLLVGMSRPPRPGQAAALVAVIVGTGGAAYAVSATFGDRLPILMAALGLLFFLGFAMRERAAGRPSLPATMLLNATAVVPVLTFQADILGAGVIETLITAAVRATLVVWLLYALFPAPPAEAATGAACHRHARDGPQWRAAHPRQGRHRVAGATLLPRRAHCARLPGATRARYLPGRPGSGGWARPTSDPTAGQPRWKHRGRWRLGGLGGRPAAARTDADGAAWLIGFRRMDHDRRAALGWRGRADRPRDLSDALRPRGVAHAIRGPGP